VSKRRQARTSIDAVSSISRRRAKNLAAHRAGLLKTLFDAPFVIKVD
jgi:hypothetical protein